VNLIGDHTDYNDGFVLPLAIDYAVWIALSPTADRTVTLYSGNFDQYVAFHLDQILHTRTGWPEYVKGVAFYLQKQGFSLHGWQGVIAANLPIGASLSSSAALEMAALEAFAAVSDLKLEPRQKALTGQQAENEWIGVQCGIMDQLASACGVKDHALFIDCRSLVLEPVRIPADCLVAILDTTTRRELTNSAYNQRRIQCETAADFFKIPKLRDLERSRLEKNRNQLDELVFKRALHVVTENERTVSAVDRLQQNDLPAVGKLLYQSHESLRDLYQVSSPALDQMVESAMESTGCFGARMTGAGFGGCAVATVACQAKETFSAELHQRYLQKSGMKAVVYLTAATKGTEIISQG
jgi:galactokinase